MLTWVMMVACGLKLALYQSAGESVGRGHVPCCGTLKKKHVGVYVSWGGRECGQIIIFGECDQNGPAAALFS